MMTPTDIQNQLTTALRAAALQDQVDASTRYTAVLRFDGLVPKMEVQKEKPEYRRYGPQSDCEMLTSVEILFFQKATSRVKLNRLGMKDPITSEAVCLGNLTAHQKLNAQAYAQERPW
jgi:hypothetical protein